MSRARTVLIGIAATVMSVGGYFAYGYAVVGTAYAAHMMCSGVFVSGRPASSLLESDLSADDLAPLRAVSTKIDVAAGRVDAHVLGVISSTAVYRDDLGCVLGDEPSASQAKHFVWHPWDDFVDDSRNETVRSRFAGALDWAFAEPDGAHPRRTRAVVVVHAGHLVAERYADGFDENTPLVGWSMAKSVVNALVGILVKDGKMSLAAPIGAEVWPAGDPRRGITLDHLLRMSSGLRFDEDSINPRGDILHMLLGAPDVPAFAAAHDLEAAPGTRWKYSSATTNIIAGAMRRAVGEAGYRTFPRRALFDRVGMSSAVIETDARGNFIGSSFMYATARDWARFGQLYLNDGTWNGERILPEGWVTYSRTPAPAAPAHEYGAHFWLRLSESYRSSTPLSLPADTFHAVGHEGQFVTIIPSRHVVIVRLGLTRHAKAWAQDEFVARVLETLAR